MAYQHVITIFFFLPIYPAVLQSETCEPKRHEMCQIVIINAK